MCPFDQNKCGGSNILNLNNTGANQNLSISLLPGESCTYQVQATCGLPSFMPLGDLTGFDVQILEYDDYDMSQNWVASYSTLDTVHAFAYT
jgi:hypothetical protein